MVGAGGSGGPRGRWLAPALAGVGALVVGVLAVITNIATGLELPEALKRYTENTVLMWTLVGVLLLLAGALAWWAARASAPGVSDEAPDGAVSLSTVIHGSPSGSVVGSTTVSGSGPSLIAAGGSSAIYASSGATVNMAPASVPLLAAPRGHGSAQRLYMIWSMAEFTPDRATVHAAIGHEDNRAIWSHELEPLPRYVPRDYDQALAPDISTAATGELHALIVLLGGSSTGKSRSLYEAVHLHCPEFQVLRPLSLEALRALPAAGHLARAPTVLWLNELQDHLGPNGTGLTRALLADLFAAAEWPLVLVASVWPEKLLIATDPTDDETRDSRELLTEHVPEVHWYRVPEQFTEAEAARARPIAEHDDRIARAVDDHDRFGFTQTLAGAHELLRRYTAAPEAARLLLHSAADARRLGIQGGLSHELLEALTRALWQQQHGLTAPPSGWFKEALAYASGATQPGGHVRALIPLGHSSSYALADYLEQHLNRQRRGEVVRDPVWQVLTNHAPIVEVRRVARAARARGRVQVEYDLLQRATTVADPRAYHQLARWFRRQGRRDEAEGAVRKAAEIGDFEAKIVVARTLVSDGRFAEAEQLLQAAAAAGLPDANRRLAQMFEQQRRFDEAEQQLRIAAASGQPDANRLLGRWLEQHGAPEEGAVYLRLAARAGNTRALRAYTRRLGDDERAAEAEETLRAAANVKTGPLRQYAAWLASQSRDDEAEQLLREAVKDGRRVRGELAQLLRRRGAATEAEQVLRDRAPDDRRALAATVRGSQRRQTQEAERLLREAIGHGHRGAAGDLAHWLERDHRLDEAEQTLRDAVKAGDSDALDQLVAFLKRRGRREEAAIVRREGLNEDGHTLNVAAGNESR